MGGHYWPTELPQLVQARNWGGGEIDTRASFSPELGRAIDRPQITGAYVQNTVGFRRLSVTQYRRFLAFLRDDLQRGTQPFAWRHPITGDLREWKIVKTSGGRLFSESADKMGRSDIQMTLDMIDVDPWYAGHVPPGLSAVPPLVLDFEAGLYGVNGVQSALADILSVSRAGAAATYFDANGVMKVAAADTARIDHDPVTGACLGLLVEGARTNEITRSETLGTDWVIGNGSIAPGGSAPDGSSMDAFVPNTSSATHSLRLVLSTLSNATPYRLSVFVKANGYDELRLQCAASLGWDDNYRADVDLTAGTISNVAGGGSANPAITDIGGGLYRIEMDAVTDGVSSSFSVQFVAKNGSTIFAGDGTSGYDIWGWQLEAGNFATSYIPSDAGTATTRAGDEVSLAVADWIAPGQGTMLFHGQHVTPGVVANRLWTLDDDASNDDVIYLYYNFGVTSLAFLADDSLGSAPYAISTTGFASGDTVKIAFGWDAASAIGAYDGAALPEDADGAAPLTGITTLHLGGNFATVYDQVTRIRSLSYFSEKLPQSTLLEMTA